MKTNILLLLLTLPVLYGRAQGVFTNHTNAALQKVIEDYPYHFRHIKGEMINSNDQGTHFRSRVDIPGSLNCVITHFSSSREEERFNWDCALFVSGNFQAAARRFKELYEEIKNTIIHIEGEKPVIINGTYQAPVDGSDATTITFQLLPAAGSLQKLRVELCLQEEAGGWKIVLSVNNGADAALKAGLATGE